VLEHVIGFHDVLVLGPLGAKPRRPRDDPAQRWILTAQALGAALSVPGVLEAQGSLIGYLTTEVLVHTWDLAKAVGVTVALDARLCGVGLDRALAHGAPLRADMFAPAFAVAEGASVQDRLLGIFGRDPHWEPPS